MTSKQLGLGLIPIALILTPLAAFGMTYDDIGDFFKNAINGVQAPSQLAPTRTPYNEPTRSGATDYSSFGDISQSEIFAMQNLAFPQSLYAMRTRFGAPSYISGNQDWFTAPGGGWIVVSYQGDRAVSMEARN